MGERVALPWSPNIHKQSSDYSMVQECTTKISGDFHTHVITIFEKQAKKGEHSERASERAMDFIGAKFVWHGANIDPEQVTLLKEHENGQCEVSRFNGKTATCPISDLYARTSQSRFHAGRKSLMDAKKVLWIDDNGEVWGGKPSSSAKKEKAAVAAQQQAARVCCYELR